MAPTDKLVWIDCEMTGLDLSSDALVEIACIVTDGELNELDEGITVVIKSPEAPLRDMDPVVVDMHTESGLLPLIESGTTLADAEAQVLAYVRGHVPEPRKAPLAGSSVYVDRGFIARDMPALDAHLHYRLVDVSSIKELVRRWFPKVYYNSPPKTGGHRARNDTRESIAELRYYRQTVLVEPPGPDTQSLRGFALEHVVDHDEPAATGD